MAAGLLGTLAAHEAAEPSGVDVQAAEASPLRGLRGSEWAAARLAARAGGASCTESSTAYAVQQIVEMQLRRTRAEQEADLSEHVKDRPQREGRRRSTPAASVPDGSDDPAAARLAAAAPTTANEALRGAALEVLELKEGCYAVGSALPDAAARAAEAAVEAAVEGARRGRAGEAMDTREA